MSKDSFKSASVMAVCVTAIFVMINVPYQYAERAGDFEGTLQPSRLSHSRIVDMPIMAGWPLNYSIRYEQDGLDEQDQPIYRLWSIARLLGDVALGGATLGVLFGLIVLRESRIDRSSNPVKQRRRFDLMLACSILLVPAILIGIAYRTTWTQERIVHAIGKKRLHLYTSNWLPEVVSRQIPMGLQRAFLRVRRVRIFQPTPDELAALSGIPTLVDLEIVEGELSGDGLSVFSKHLHLARLSLRRMQLDSQQLARIPEFVWLTELSLSGSKFSEPAFRKLDGINKLKSIDLSNCPMPLSSLGKPTWAQTLEYLHVTRPPPGMSDSLRIVGWPKLERIDCQNPFRGFNREAFLVELRDLPRLTSILLDRNQLHELQLVDLPRFQRIHDEPGPDFIRAALRRWIPGMTWVRRIELDRVPSLHNVSIFAQDLQELVLGDISSLQELAISSQMKSMLNDFRYMDIEKQHCASWIETIGNALGPHALSLSGLPINEIDLSPISSNRKIRQLKFLRCSVEAEQLKTLAPMNWLSSLTADDCQLHNNDLSWLVDQFPEIRHLQFDGEKLHRFSFIEETPIRQVVSGPLRSMEHFELMNQISLRSDFRFGKTPETLLIRNNPKLVGLVFGEPLFPSSIVEGCRDLQWFAGGGVGVDDAMMEEILRCSMLAQLTVAYPGASKESLHKIGRLRKLMKLTVPGAEVDDEVVSHWQQLRGLWEVNLDDNPIGPRTLEWLHRNPKLRYLSLDRLHCQGEKLDGLNKLTQLTHLSLARSPIQTQNIKSLLAGDTLEAINLAGCQLDEEAITLLGKNRSLRWLRLSKGQLSTDQQTQLSESNPSLELDYVDLETFVWPIPVTPPTEKHLPFAWETLSPGKGQLKDSVNEGAVDFNQMAGGAMDSLRSDSGAGYLKLRKFRELLQHQQGGASGAED